MVTRDISGDPRANTRSASPDIGSSISKHHGFGSRASAFTRQSSVGDAEEEEEDDTISDLHVDSTEAADILPMMNKPRSKTISYSSSGYKPVSPDVHLSAGRRLNTNTAKDIRTGILPNFVFLQLYHMGVLHMSNMPVPVPDSNKDFSRGLNILKRMAPYETHKVGVVYVGKSQANDEAAILSNTYGSQRYSQFLKRLGTLLTLKHCKPEDMYIGGLDHEEDVDGKYTYAWHDEVIQMVFHVATMMPTTVQDTKCINKKRHIGNNFVTIVYNDSGEPYSMGTIKGKFNYVNIVIEPLDQVSNAVSLQCKDEIKQILEHVSTKVISDEHISELVQQIALHSSMASLICERSKNEEFYASNWLERLRQIKKMRDKIPLGKKLSERLSHKSGDKSATSCDMWVTDFTEYS